MSAVISFGVPVLFFIVTTLIRTRSFWDLNNAILGVSYALTTGSLFQVFIKWLIGGFRPHFFATCKPLSPLNLVGRGYQGLIFDRTIYTTTSNEIRESSTSFPSGHSMAAFAGFLFLSLYINAKFKGFRKLPHLTLEAGIVLCSHPCCNRHLRVESHRLLPPLVQRGRRRSNRHTHGVLRLPHGLR